MPKRSLRNEDGASLVIVLVVMTVFGLILGGLMTETGASVRYTTTVSNLEKKMYAADAGVAAGIQQLQQHNQVCPTTGSTETLHTVTVNGYDVNVACEVTAGSTVGGLGYAIVTRSNGPNSLVTQGGSGPKLVNGPVYVGGGFDGNPGMKVTNGTFEQGTLCTSATPAGLTLDAGYGYSCGAAEPAVDPPAIPALPSTPRASQTSGTCTYFYPGKYTSTPTLGSGTNYFASGVYYFENVGQWAISRALFGGAPATFETARYTMPTCANDADAIVKAGGNVPEVTGTGAQFVLGGNSSLYLDNGSQVEIFARTLDGTSENVSASIVAVPSTWTGWTASAINTTVYDFHNGSNPDSVVHGLMYVPSQNARLWSTNAVDAAVMGGIVAWELELQSSASGSGLQVSAGNGVPAPRHLVISSTAPAVPDSAAGKQVTSTAVVEIANNAAKTVTVHSWRTKGVTESL